MKAQQVFCELKIAQDLNLPELALEYSAVYKQQGGIASQSPYPGHTYSRYSYEHMSFLTNFFTDFLPDIDKCFPGVLRNLFSGQAIVALEKNLEKETNSTQTLALLNKFRILSFTYYRSLIYTRYYANECPHENIQLINDILRINRAEAIKSCCHYLKIILLLRTESLDEAIAFFNSLPINELIFNHPAHSLSAEICAYEIGIHLFKANRSKEAIVFFEKSLELIETAGENSLLDRKLAEKRLKKAKKIALFINTPAEKPTDSKEEKQSATHKSIKPWAPLKIKRYLNDTFNFNMPKELKEIVDSLWMFHTNPKAILEDNDIYLQITMREKFISGITLDPSIDYEDFTLVQKPLRFRIPLNKAITNSRSCLELCSQTLPKLLARLQEKIIAQNPWLNLLITQNISLPQFKKLLQVFTLTEIKALLEHQNTPDRISALKLFHFIPFNEAIILLGLNKIISSDKSSLTLCGSFVSYFLAKSFNLAPPFQPGDIDLSARIFYHQLDEIIEFLEANGFVLKKDQPFIYKQYSLKTEKNTFDLTLKFPRYSETFEPNCFTATPLMLDRNGFIQGDTLSLMKQIEEKEMHYIFNSNANAYGFFARLIHYTDKLSAEFKKSPDTLKYLNDKESAKSAFFVVNSVTQNHEWSLSELCELLKRNYHKHPAHSKRCALYFEAFFDAVFPRQNNATFATQTILYMDSLLQKGIKPTVEQLFSLIQQRFFSQQSYPSQQLFQPAPDQQAPIQQAHAEQKRPPPPNF